MWLNRIGSICIMKKARIYVIYGQGGLITSLGMYSLSQRIKKLYPSSVVSTHEWGYPDTIVSDIRKQPLSVPIILIGYSLGANCVTWVSEDTLTTINLAVCYDPTRYSRIAEFGKNVKRSILYKNDSWFFGGANIPSAKEIIEISTLHILVDHQEKLHTHTLEAIEHELAD
jgi:hypothetical protein